MTRRFSDHDLALARERYYPYWWLHKVSEGRSLVTDMPTYSLVCANEGERELALASKPPFLEAQVTLSPDRRL